MRRLIITTLSITAIAMSGCASHQPKPSQAVAPVAPAPVVVIAHAHDSVNAVVWSQNSAEYRALTHQAYNAALAAVERGVNNASINALPDSEQSPLPANAPLAVISDLDETLLNSMAFNARVILNGYDPNLPADQAGPEFKKRWKAWVKEEKALAMPGALAFTEAVDKLGVTFFYVTNREDDERESTCGNLRKVGYPLKDCKAQVLTRNDADGRPKDKGSRRIVVGKTHRVVAVLGDNFGDFLNGGYGDPKSTNTVQQQRNDLIQSHKQHWGTQWFFFPNPAYGSWEEIIAGTIPKVPAPATIGEREHLMHQAKLKHLEPLQTSTPEHQSSFEQ